MFERHQSAMEHAICALKILQPQVTSATQLRGSPDLSTLAVAFHNLAVEQEFLGMHEEACESYSRACQISDTSLGAHHQMSIALHRSLQNSRQALLRRPPRKQPHAHVKNGHHHDANVHTIGSTHKQQPPSTAPPQPDTITRSVAQPPSRPRQYDTYSGNTGRPQTASTKYVNHTSSLQPMFHGRRPSRRPSSAPTVAMIQSQRSSELLHAPGSHPYTQISLPRSPVAGVVNDNRYVREQSSDEQTSLTDAIEEEIDESLPDTVVTEDSLQEQQQSISSSNYLVVSQPNLSVSSVKERSPSLLRTMLGNRLSMVSASDEDVPEGQLYVFGANGISLRPL